MKFNLRILSGYISKHHLWFRLFGHGLVVKDTRHCFMMFSERKGYHTAIRLGPYYIRYLPAWGDLWYR